MGEAFNYADESRARSRCLKKDIEAVMTVAGLVAGGFRPLRPALHPDGVAQPRARTASRRRGGAGSGMLRFARSALARQCQPRQGAPAALAGQTEVRSQDFVGDLMV